jgi:hypothetical protein
MLRFSIIYKLTVILILFTAIFSTSKSFAQTPPKEPECITVIPSIMTVDLKTDPPEYEIRYINNTPAEITLLLSAQDFTELEDGYKISFLEGKDAENYKYSLSSWISFENKNIQLAPREEKSIKIFIDSKRLTVGGHYASILAKVDQSNSKKSININPVISSLLFVRAASGNEIESGKISSFKPDRSLFNFPKKFALRFQNNGNVFITPYGTLEIYDPRGKKIATSVLNEGSLNTLPESIRRYDINVKPTTKILLPGIYTAKLSMHYGNSKKQINESIKFFSDGSIDLIKITLVLIVIILVLYFIRKRRSKSKS